MSKTIHATKVVLNSQFIL